MPVSSAPVSSVPGSSVPVSSVPGSLPALALVSVVLLALALRGPVSSVGPLLDELRDDFGLQGPPGALLPALPLLCFGLLAPIAPALSRRLGLHRAVLAGAAVLALGLALRNVGVPGLFLGTLLVGSGIAVVNVLLSAVVKPTSPTGCRWRPP